MSSIAQLLEQAEAAVDSARDLGQLDRVRVEFLGRKGAFTVKLRELGTLPPGERPAAGQAINEAKQALVRSIETRRAALDAARIEAELAAQTIDVTLPGRGQPSGQLHPVTRTLRRMVEILRHAGFEVHTGPEVEDDFHNFTALNIPENHPARAMHDTFYLAARDENLPSRRDRRGARPARREEADSRHGPPESGLLLRTHTSPVQIRSMLAHGAPLRIIVPGRVYRCDSDLTHTPMFTQIEGLAVDRDISFANLKSLLYEFVSNFFERDAKLRFRPSYFPFTEPSAEVDVLSESGDWLEILGCGMVHPNVLRNCGVDPARFSGYAFGMGVDRLAMLRYGVKDLRSFFDNDTRFLRQFA